MISANLIGKRFGLLTVVKRTVLDKWKHIQWECVCDCGGVKTVTTGTLNYGNVKSCGCLNHPKGENHPYWKGGKIEVPCANPECNKTKLMYPSRKRIYEKFYCSTKCSGIHRLKNMTGNKHPKWKERIKVECAYCGKFFEVADCIKRLYKNHFCKGTDCQSKCNSANRKGIANSNYRGGTPEMRIIRKRIAASMRKAIRQGKGGRTWESLVDYSMMDLVDRLKSTIPQGYSWDKDFIAGKGMLHIDHVKPMSSFTFAKAEDEEFRRCFSLDNLQLLPAIENMRKSGKLNYAVNS